MARSVEGPWYRTAKDAWYATLAGGRKVALGVKGEGNRADAVKAWHKLMADPPVAPIPKPAAPAVATVRQMVDAYLSHTAPRVTPRCQRNYTLFLSPLADAYGDRPVLTLTADDVTAFLNRQATWGSTYKAQFHGTAAQMCRWAVGVGYLPRNIMSAVPRPPKRSRGADAVLTADEHARLLTAADPDTRDLLAVLWATGARPSEVAGLTAEQVRAAGNGVLTLADHKTAHKGKSRHLILTGDALAVVRRRAEAVGNGLLFPGRNGKLTATAIGHRLTKLCKRAGVRHVIAYGYRHTYATDALANGVPDATVASLLGHCDTSMIHKHYSHLSARTRALQDAAARVRG